MNIGLDLDGTLLDSSFRHILVLNHVLNGQSDINQLKDFVKYKSDGRNGLDYLNYKGIPEPKKIFSHWKELIETDKYLQYDTLFADTLYFLEEIFKSNNLYLVTARNNNIGLMNTLDSLNIKQYFEEIYIVNSGSNKFEKTKHIDFNFIIGDTEVDREWSISANCDFLALNRGFRSKNYWRKRGVPSYTCLLNILKILKKD